jgi:hypothetical protein
MKRLLPFLSLAIVLAACNSTPKNSTTANLAAAEPQVQAMSIDTAGLAQYQAWKAKNELNDAEEYNRQESRQTATPVKKTTKAKKPKPAPASVSLPAPADNTESSAPQTGTGTDASSNSGTMTNASGDEAKAEQKEGVSKAAKGAVIGGVVGGAAGAVINKKNRVVGAVVGAVIGAGGGYVLGRKMDKKDGRY